MPLHRCKFCKMDFPSYRDLRRHSAEEHSAEFQQVAQWLGRSVAPRLEVLERLAEEGLVGYKEKHDQ